MATGTTSTPLTDGNWHFIVGVYDGSMFRVFVDGVQLGAVADPYGVTYSQQPINIGRNSNSGGGSHDYYNGAIDQVLIYNTGLSVRDILALSGQAPAAPSALQITSITPISVNLSWTASTDSSVTQYVMQRSVDGNFDDATSTVVSAASTTFTDLAVQPLATYYYRVRAINPTANSPLTATLPVTVPAATPSIVVDNRTSGVISVGKWWGATNATGYYGADFYNDGNQLKGTKSITYPAKFATAGTYAVFARWPASATAATSVPIDINSAGGAVTINVNQHATPGQWVYLGSYAFNATGGSIVIRTTGTVGLVLADAIGFSPSNSPQPMPQHTAVPAVFISSSAPLIAAAFISHANDLLDLQKDILRSV